MEINDIVERIVRARNTLGELNLTGIENARKVITIYDHLTETASLLAKRAEEETKDAGNQ